MLKLVKPSERFILQAMSVNHLLYHCRDNMWFARILSSQVAAQHNKTIASEIRLLWSISRTNIFINRHQSNIWISDEVDDW